MNKQKPQHQVTYMGHTVKFYLPLLDGTTHSTYFGDEPAQKIACPRFGTKVADGMWVCYGDVDTLAGYEDWDSLRAHLDHLGINHIKSYSGKVKIILTIASISKPSRRQLKSAMIHHLDGLDIEIDLGAIDHSYIHPSQFDKFSKILSESIPVVVTDTDWDFTVKAPMWMHEKLDKVDLRVMEFILSSRLEATHMPVKYVASQIGCSTTKASRSIQKCRDLGFIKCSNSSYKVNEYGKEYQLDGVLEMESRHTRMGGMPSIVFTAPFTDGNWFRPLLTATNFYATKDEYMQFVQSLPGVSKPGKRRIKKAEQAWRYHSLDSKKS